MIWKTTNLIYTAETTAFCSGASHTGHTTLDICAYCSPILSLFQFLLYWLLGVGSLNTILALATNRDNFIFSGAGIIDFGASSLRISLAHTIFRSDCDLNPDIPFANPCAFCSGAFDTEIHTDFDNSSAFCSGANNIDFLQEQTFLTFCSGVKYTGPFQSSHKTFGVGSLSHSLALVQFSDRWIQFIASRTEDTLFDCCQGALNIALLIVLSTVLFCSRAFSAEVSLFYIGICGVGSRFISLAQIFYGRTSLSGFLLGAIPLACGVIDTATGQTALLFWAAFAFLVILHWLTSSITQVVGSTLCSLALALTHCRGVIQTGLDPFWPSTLLTFFRFHFWTVLQRFSFWTQTTAHQLVYTLISAQLALADTGLSEFTFQRWHLSWSFRGVLPTDCRTLWIYTAVFCPVTLLLAWFSVSKHSLLIFCIRPDYWYHILFGDGTARTSFAVAIDRVIGLTENRLLDTKTPALLCILFPTAFFIWHTQHWNWSFCNRSF